MWARRSIRGLILSFCAPIAAAMLAPRVAAQAPQPGQGSSTLPVPPSPQTHAEVPVFEFHSGFWVNVHHFLYQQARLREKLPISRSAGEAVRPGSGAESPSKPLSPVEQRAWDASLDYYAKDLAGRDLLFDIDMVLINDRLAEMEDCPDLSGRDSPSCASGLRPELITALELAAPVYRAHWWAEQDRENRAWIAAVAPLVANLGGSLARQLAVIYHSAWPAKPIRVDVSCYAGPFGAYTSLDPLHITLSSTDPRNQGPTALEIVFHEASHGLATGVQDTIAKDCREQSKPIPRDLWHALLFYTTGEVIQRAFRNSAAPATGNSEEYVPYAVRNGLYSRNWQGYEHLLELYWQPYLDGQTDFATALARLTAAL